MEALFSELARGTSGRERFATATRPDLRAAAKTFSRYMLPTLAAIRLTDGDALLLFLADLREVGRMLLLETQLTAQLLNHFDPHLVRPRANSDDPPFEAAGLPERLRGYSADLSCLWGLPEAQSADGELC